MSIRVSSISSVLAIAGLVLLPACGTTSNEVVIPDDDAWVDDPGKVEGTLASVGMAIFVANEGAARTSAEADARAKMAATLKSEINQLVEDWSKEAGDLQIAGSLSSYINNETFTRQYVDTEIRGARAQAYRKRGNTMYCLMLMDIDRVKEWYDKMGSAIESEALRDASLWKTEAMKSQARDRFDKIKKEHQDAQIEKVQALSGNAPAKSEGDS